MKTFLPFFRLLPSLMMVLCMAWASLPLRAGFVEESKIKKIGSGTTGFPSHDKPSDKGKDEAKKEAEEPVVFRNAMHDKLDAIVIKQVSFENTPLKSALDYLVSESRASDPSHKGVVMLLTGNREAFNDIKVTLDLRNIPLSEALRYLSIVTGIQYRVDPEAVSISEPAAPGKEGTPLPPMNRSIATLLQRKSVLRALCSIVLKKVEFQETPAVSAFDYLVTQSRKADPDGSGISVIPLGDPDLLAASKVTLNLQDVTLLEAIRYTAQVANLKFRVEPYAVFVVPSGNDEKPGPQTSSLDRDVDLLIGGNSTSRKLGAITIPQIAFDETPIRNAVDYLIAEGRKADPKHQGVNFVLALSPDQLKTTVTLDLRNVTLAQALKFLTQVTGVDAQAENNAVVLTSNANSKK